MDHKSRAHRVVEGTEALCAEIKPGAAGAAEAPDASK